MNVPTAKRPHRITFFLVLRVVCNSIGIGRMIIMMSEEMLNTVLVMRWLVAAEHWTECLCVSDIFSQRNMAEREEATHHCQEAQPSTG